MYMGYFEQVTTSVRVCVSEGVCQPWFACSCDMPLNSDWVPELGGFLHGRLLFSPSLESVLLFIFP